MNGGPIDGELSGHSVPAMYIPSSPGRRDDLVDCDPVERMRLDRAVVEIDQTDAAPVHDHVTVFDVRVVAIDEGARFPSAA